jgi:RNA polymerase sigma factor for flagellar operon FliA
VTARCGSDAYAALQSTLHRTPTESEVAAELRITEAQLQVIFIQLSFVNVVALDELLTPDGEGGGLRLRETLADVHAEDPVAEAGEVRRVLATAVAALPAREQTVVTLYYYEHLTLAEIGRVLGVTERAGCASSTPSRCSSSVP